MPLLKRLQVMSAKVETTIGTAETLTATEGVFNAYELSIQASIDVEERESQGSFNYLSGVPGARQGKMTFKTDLGWNGTTMPTWASVLLPCCGFVESTQVYTPRSEGLGANVKSATIGIHQNGIFKKLAGAVGTFKIVCPAGKVAMIEWEFTGVWQAVTDTTIIAPTYPTDTPIRFASATVTYDSVVQVVENVTIDAGNEVIMREDPATAGGFISGLIVSRKPMITTNPEATLVATDDPFGDWLAASEAVFSCGLDGPTGLVTNGTIVISAPKAQIINVQEGDRNKLLINEIEMSCNKNGATANQELAITFTDKADA